MPNIRQIAMLCSQRELRPRLAPPKYRDKRLKTKIVSKCPITGKRMIATQSIVSPIKKAKLDEPRDSMSARGEILDTQSQRVQSHLHDEVKQEKTTRPRILKVRRGRPSGKILPGMSPVIKKFVDETMTLTSDPMIVDQKPVVSRVYQDAELNRPKTSSTDRGRPSQVLLEMDGFLWAHCDELDLERCLLGGQCFRWTKRHLGQLTIFTGVIKDNVFQLWRISQQSVSFRVLNDPPDQLSVQQKREILTDYFRLNYNLRDLYSEWSVKDENFAKCATQYKGFRILRQDPIENLFSFICATNNNIKRITQMVNNMCSNFGQRINIHHSYQATEKALGPFYKFPTVERLAEADVFDTLRYKLSFGYRAKFIQSSAKALVDHSKEIDCTVQDYLLSLRELKYEETCDRLKLLPGIGRKVADCISLMSMDHLDSVPVDVHIYKIVCRCYQDQWSAFKTTLKTPKGRPKFTKETHDSVRAFFTHLYGPLAGWSTSVLFIAELKHLKPTEDDKIEKNK